MRSNRDQPGHSLFLGEPVPKQIENITTFTRVNGLCENVALYVLKQGWRTQNFAVLWLSGTGVHHLCFKACILSDPYLDVSKP